MSSPVVDSHGSPSARALPQPDAMASVDFSSSPTKENESPFDVDAKRASGLPTRTPTLSWQRRPPSQASERPKSRPLSIVAAENAAARSSSLSDDSEPAASRDQIAQALSSKDPSWFRQTADRGQNSAAYRREQVEDEDRLDMSSMRAQLPGMSNAAGTRREQASLGDSPSIARVGSPITLTPAQRLEPPAGDAGSSVTRDAYSPMSPPSGRTSPTRPVSPTKGVGGFVQSAMMKRTDSVKRWSVTSPAGLQRVDSTASTRASLDNTQRTSNSQPRSSSRPGSRSKESQSRPTSSHGPPEIGLASLDGTSGQQPAEPTKPRDAEKTTPPASPSKTMDPRRWSPTKSSSWLEAALNKPESPKPKPTPPASSQPAWMVELNKSKAQKAGTPGADLERTASSARKHEVKTGGLMRSSPMGSGVKPATVGAIRTYPSPAVNTDKPLTSGFRSSLSRSTSGDGIESPDGDSGKSPLVDNTSSPTNKIKPETPPKKDFRSNLKPRQPPPQDAKDEGNEFKNVFGNLKKTKTQNYVAPDIFKDNITRGKAALNITGGPKPREKKDELKDAILAKKAEFKQAKIEGRGIATNSHSPVDKPIPEGLAKKMEMNRSNTMSSSRRGSATSETASPTHSRAGSKSTSLMATISKRDSTDTLSTPVERDSPAAAPSPILQKESTPASRFQKPGGSALADRFNPALAGFLARGPPPMASGPSKDAEKSATEEPSAPGPQLTHMTKNRARGPKRRAPASAAKAADEQQQQPPALSASPSRIGASEAISPSPAPVKLRKAETEVGGGVISLVDSSRKTTSEPNVSSTGVVSLVDSSAKRSVVERSPSSGGVVSLVDSSRPASRPRSPTKIHEQVAAIAARAQQGSGRVAQDGVEEQPPSQPSSPRKLDMKRMSKFLDESNNRAAEEPPRPLSPSKTGGSRPLPEPRPLSPQKTGGRALPEPPKKEYPSEKVDSEPVVSVRNGAAMFGGAATSAAKPAPFVSPPPLDSGRPRSPTKSASGPSPVFTSPGPVSPPITSPMRSPTKYAQEVSALFNDFFGKARPARSYRADAAEILMRRPRTPPKIQTQRLQLFRLSGDGKKQPVPSHHERVLFEREMYICGHTFTNEAGKKVNEVYFWAGDEVPESTIEDAKVFISREAKSLGGKLIQLRQGKETSEFMQALGGIVITRRGSSNKYDSLASNMLCGRRYLGQIAFDEVDLSPNCLCSGFPYLIAQQGKCYLWKGRGSDVDELSCARLIGMDLALMGELIEVEDGKEPADFWNLFDGGAKAGSADHWRLKPNYDKYCGRLFCSDASSRQQVSP